MLQNSQKCRVLWYNCHRTHRSVGYYCIQISQGNLCGVPDLLQNSQKCRALWCNCHRTHRSIGYCGTAVTELTEVLCRVKMTGVERLCIGSLSAVQCLLWLLYGAVWVDKQSNHYRTQTPKLSSPDAVSYTHLTLPTIYSV